jgi:DNA-3-methyladenine glycosylase I
MSYCSYLNTMSGPQKELHQAYHDKQYGFPIHNDDELFARLILEINQAGLSWETILKKQDNFRDAYRNFDITKVAAFDEQDRARLMENPGIIRNRLKINAAIENAKKILLLQKEYGSFEKWLDVNHPKPLQEWMKIFKKTFKFTGGEIVNEFLVSTGYLSGAHSVNCPIFHKVIKSDPAWNRK